MISAVIVNWNSGTLLEKCVSSIVKYGGGCEILVVDNASADSSADFLSDAADLVVLIRNDKNIGFAAAANKAWHRSTGGWILFLNPDTECLPDAVDRLAEPLIHEAGTWAAGGLLLDTSGIPQAGFNVRAFPSIGSVAADMLLLDELWPGNPWTRTYRMSEWDPRKVSDVCQPAAACLMASRRALEVLGGFDERFSPAWFEDVDLCRRIWKAGGRIRFEPRARFIHRGGYSLARMSREEFLAGFHTNQIRYFAKHHGKGAAERVRKLIVSGMLLRASLSLARRPGEGGTRVDGARAFWKTAGRFHRMRSLR
jgi:N-acetylglucosaminyl-diphospho-decaprenol L-rhamnosyltransferase